MSIYESGEDYLLAILVIKERKGLCHSIDVAEETGYSKASVSIAMKKLRENGYIQMNQDGTLELLETGLTIAKKIHERNTVLTDYFKQLGVDPDIAYHDAHKIEHDLSDQTFSKIKEEYLKIKNKRGKS
ncbi:metal-dependent transcriptional regulator [Bulleidia extructa]|uniref:metal-dependent transcriptional regulator n=1 Tax=Bulleidia extructa TaxID=118748 RepID=UPI003BF10FA9